MTVKNKTLSQLVQENIDLFSKPNPLGIESKIIRQNQVTVGDKPGWKIELFMGSETEPYYYLFQVLTIDNGISYIVVCMGSHLETNVNKYKFNEVEFHASGIDLA
jgi:hypothetical protein